MKKFHVYRLSDGRFTGQVVASTRIETVQVAADLNLIDGVTDWQSQRVVYEQVEDVVDGHLVMVTRPKLIDYQPPQPSDQHEWNTIAKRWQLNEAAKTIESTDAKARAEITALMEKLPRAQLEHSLGIVTTEEDRTRGALTLAEIQTRLVALRSKLKR